MQHGFIARIGLLAALMAEGGYSGIKNAFEEPYGGFLSTFGQRSGKQTQYLLEELTGWFGQTCSRTALGLGRSVNGRNPLHCRRGRRVAKRPP